MFSVPVQGPTWDQLPVGEGLTGGQQCPGSGLGSNPQACFCARASNTVGLTPLVAVPLAGGWWGV